MNGFDIDWSMARPGNAGNALLQGFERGQQIRAERDTRSALAAYQSNPNSSSLNALIGHNPALGYRAAEFQAKEDQRGRDTRYRAAFRDYVTAGDTPDQASSADESGGTPDHVAHLDARTAAFLRMAEEDPGAAQSARLEEYKAIKERLAIADSAYDFAISRLANVSDDASYQAVIADAARRFGPLGVDIREQVPRSYPGPEGVRQLLQSAMGAKEQLAAMDRKARLDWDIQDDLADNARQDRNTDSMISDRGARRALTARGQDMADVRGRRGQDMADRRGRDIADMTDRRTREGWRTQKAGTGRRGGAGGGQPPRITSKAQYDALPSGALYVNPNGDTMRKK